MKQLQADMKSGELKQVYLLFGEERYLVDQFRDKLLDAVMPERDSMNYNSFRGKDISAGEIIDLAETMPFFAERRVILIEDSDWFKSGGDQLAEYLKHPAESVFILFAEHNVDKRSRLYKALKDVGYAAEFTRQTPEMIRKWVLSRLKAEKCLITERALELFLEKAGEDMLNIANELEKLISYTYGREGITEADVETVCTAQTDPRIFEMVEAIGFRDQHKALNLYYDLLQAKEPPLRILVLIGRQFAQLLQIRELRAARKSPDEVAAATGIKSWPLKRFYYPMSERFTTEELKDALRLSVEADENIKTGKITDRLSVELLIITCSQAAKKA